MITGYVTYEHDPDAPDFVNDFNRAGLDMIESAAAAYPFIVAHRMKDANDAITLNLHAPTDDEDDEDALVDFLRELEDTNLGYLLWETDTEKEHELLRSANTAVLSVEVRGEGFASTEGPILWRVRVRRPKDGSIVLDEPTAHRAMRAAGVPIEAPGRTSKDPGLFYVVLARDEVEAATKGEVTVDGEAYLLEISP